MDMRRSVWRGIFWFLTLLGWKIVGALRVPLDQVSRRKIDPDSWSQARIRWMIQAGNAFGLQESVLEVSMNNAD